MWKKLWFAPWIALSLVTGTGWGDAPNTARPVPKAAAPQAKVPAGKRVLTANAAGIWYPGNGVELNAMLDRFLVNAGPATLPGGTAPIRAILAPHASYAMSGQTAAEAYKLLRGRTFKRVVVLGASHRLGYGGLAVTDVSHFATPLGEIPVDGQAVATLAANPLANFIPRAFQGEHSIDLQLPLLQKTLGTGWSLVPILVGELDREGYAKAAALIRPLLTNQTLLVISGDFTRYGPNYQFTPFPPDEAVAVNLRQLDMGAWELVQHRDLDGFLTYQEKNPITACAATPLAILLNLMPQDSRAILVRYDTSGALRNSYTNSVSYIASVFASPEPLFAAKPQVNLSQEQLLLLHRMAQRALEVGVTQGPQAVVVQSVVEDVVVPERLNEASGVFVTLTRAGELRGSIGAMESAVPLYQGVIENAVRAARFDKRFDPVTADELDQLMIKIEILSPLRKVEGVEEIQLGRHGIVLTKGEQRAVHLPDGGGEQKSSLAETLSQLAEKAGLPGEGWQQGAVLEIFTSQVYTAPYKTE